MRLHIWYAIARNVIKKNTERKMNKEKLDKQLRILESVAEKLVNGCLTSGNIAHDGKTKGYTIQNVVNNIRRIVAEDDEDAVHAIVDRPLIGHDFPNIYPNYRELKDYCDKNGIKDNAKVKLIIIEDRVV